MDENRYRRDIYYPVTTADLLALYRNHPESLVWNGGTWLIRQSVGPYVELPSAVVHLGGVDDLSKIILSERRLDVGAAASLAALLRLGSAAVPLVLARALSSVGSASLRNLATVAGNLCVPDRCMSLVPALVVLGASVELRRQGGLRWVPLSQFRRPSGGTVLESGELVTRIRIPREDWTHHCFRFLGASIESEDSLVFAAVARVERESLGDIRICIVGPGPLPRRSRELELELVGRRLPLSVREVAALAERVGDFFPEGDTDGYSARRTQRLLASFIAGLS